MAEQTNVIQPKGSEVIGESQLPMKLQSLWQKGKSALEMNNYDYVISLLQAVLKEEPRFLDGRKLLREAAIRKKDTTKRLIPGGSSGLGTMRIQPLVKKDPQAAIVQVEKEVLAVDPYNPQGNQLLFDACSAAGLPMTAGFALETLVRGNPENAKYMHQLGDYYLAQGFNEQAALTFDKIVSIAPQDLEAVQKGKNAAAKATMEKTTFDKGIRGNLRNAAEAAELERKNKAAMTPEQREQRIADLQAEYAADNENLQVVRMLAELYEDKDDYETALSYYDWAHHLSKGDVALERKALEVREALRDRKIRELSQWLAENEGHEDYDRVKAELSEFTKQHYETQAAEYKTQVQRNPTDTDLRFKYGEALYQSGNYREAIPELQRAQSSPNLRVKSMMMLGKCYEGTGMNDMAIDQLKSAADEISMMDDTKKEALYALGLIYEKVGDKENHIACMKQIAQSDWGYKDVADRVQNSYG